jgi:hypothetical protein
MVPPPQTLTTLRIETQDEGCTRIGLPKKRSAKLIRRANTTSRISHLDFIAARLISPLNRG